MEEARALKELALSLQAKGDGPVGSVIRAMDALLAGDKPNLDDFKAARFDVSQFAIIADCGMEQIHFLYERTSRLLGLE
jgi:hypothetical protein